MVDRGRMNAQPLSIALALAVSSSPAPLLAQELNGKAADQKPEFNKYWRQGRAELCRFELSAQYAEIAGD